MKVNISKWQRKFEKNIDVLAALMIGFLTFLVAVQKSPFEYTLSMIGNWFNADERVKFLIWGILVSALLIWLILKIYREMNFDDKKSKWLIILAGVSLVLSALIPMLNRMPVPKDLREITNIGFHEVFGALFVIFFAASLYLFSKHLANENQRMSKLIIDLLIIIAGGSIVILFVFGFTGIFELFFFISLSIALIIVERIVKRNSPARIRTWVPGAKGLYT